jgi:apolipoprotein N-acyltransferase
MPKCIKSTLWILLSLFSALLLVLSFPFPGISLIAWVALVPLFFVMMTENFKKVVLSAVITAVVFNVVYLIWMKEYKHPLSLIGGVFGELLFFLFAVILSWFLSKKLRFMKVLCLSLGWMFVDYLRTVGYLAFPWGILGYTQYKNLFMIQTASIFGVWGINFLILFCNAAVASSILEYIREKRVRRNIRNLAAVALCCILFVAFGMYKLHEEKKRNFPTKKIALIQANFDPWSPELDKNIDREIELTRQSLEHNPDLIVWSESSVPFYYKFYLQKQVPRAWQVHKFIVYLDKPFLIGSLEFEGEYGDGEFKGDFYNVGIYYNNGEMNGVYRKIHLVPFGEWFPYGRIFPFVSRILENAGAGDFTPGTDYTVFDAQGLKFSALICFEDVFGNLARKFVLGGSELLVNITNDAWTGSEKAEVQHFAISVFRTVENRRSLVRAANGGVTACVNPYGRVLDSLDLFTSDYLVCVVPTGDRSELTLYTKYGDYVPKLVLILVFAGLLYIACKELIDRTKKKKLQ